MSNLPLVPFATVRAANGMVASIDHLASTAGVALMRLGGNAADAAVAASAVLAVTAQHTCGMGGDVWALVHHTTGQPPAALNASGRSGSGADPARLRAEGHTSMPPVGDIRAVTVPGCVDGWLTLHQRFGRLRLEQVLQPAIELATDGFPLPPQAESYLKQLVDVANTDDYLLAEPAGAGRLPSEGTLVRRPGVASALRSICEHGRSGFYEGDFGADLIELGTSQVGGAEFTAIDLAEPLADWVEPLEVQAWGHRIWTVPPNSQGYLTLAAAWIADQLEVPADIDDALAVHLLAEAAKQAAFDRLDVLHENAAANQLLAPEYLAPRLAAIDPAVVSECAPEPPSDFPLHNASGTNYLAAVDADRMGVSLIQSNASGWGAQIFTPRNRISLQNRGIGFALQPGHPAEYGPGRRPPHTLSPALVQNLDGSLRAVLGTMGGDNQPQVVLQLLARLLHGAQAPGEAVAARRWRWGRSGASLFDTWSDIAALELFLEGEPGASGTGEVAELEADLRERGHRTATGSAFSDSFGHAHIVQIEVGTNETGVLAAASDPRALTSAAVGY